MNKQKLTAIRKLSGTRNFVLLTDTESLIYLRGINVDDFGSVQVVAAHVAELEAFREQLDQLIKLYDKQVSKTLGVPTETRKYNDVKRNKPGKKRIPVKEDK